MRLIITLFLLWIPVFAVFGEEITMWHDAKTELLQKLTAEFEAGHPDIKIKLVHPGPGDMFEGYIQKAEKEGKLPDLIWWGPQATGKLAKKGLIVKAQELIAADEGFDKKGIYDGLWEVSKYRGEIWSLPFDANNIAVYYNIDLFEKENIDASSITSWEKFIEAAKKLTVDENNDGVPERYAFSIPLGNQEWTVWSWQAYLWQAGGEFLQNEHAVFNSFAGVKALRYWNDLIYKYKAANFTVRNDGQNMADFLSGRTAMMINGPWNDKMLKEIKNFRCGSILFPAEMRKATNIGGENLFIMKSTGAKEKAAWEFAKHVMSKEFQVKWAIEAGYIPVCISAGESAEYREYINENNFLRTYYEQMRYGKARPSVPEYPYISAYLGEQLENAVTNKLPPEIALENAEEYAETILGRGN